MMTFQDGCCVKWGACSATTDEGGTRVFTWSDWRLLWFTEPPRTTGNGEQCGSVIIGGKVENKTYMYLCRHSTDIAGGYDGQE